MSSTAAPYGFVPIYHPSGQNRPRPYTIASGYGTAIGKGDMVILNTNGTITAGTTAADLLGCFVGVQYTDANGVPVTSPNWVASTTATNIIAWVVDDPTTVYQVQSSGSIAATAIGDQADLVTGTVNATTGLSTQALNSALAGAGVQAQFRIVELGQGVSNAWGDSYTEVQVQLARSQFVSNKVAI